jgi:predicted aminopeptidase
MRVRKAEIFSTLDQQIADLEKRLGFRSSYREAEQGLNNAYLASIATYYDCVPGFERLLAGKDGDLRQFYDAVRELAKKPRQERHNLLCQTPPSVTAMPSGDSDRADAAGSDR